MKSVTTLQNENSQLRKLVSALKSENAKLQKKVAHFESKDVASQNRIKSLAMRDRPRFICGSGLTLHSREPKAARPSI